MKTNDFATIFDVLRKLEKQHLVVANGTDEHSIESVAKAVELEYISATLIGDSKKIKEVCKKRGFSDSKFNVVDINNPEEATRHAVSMIRNNEASILMKGLVTTDVFMRAILNKETGLLGSGALLSHVAILKIPQYSRLLIASDVAIIPLPTLEQKRQIVKYMVYVAERLGIEKPKVACIAATELPILSMPACADAIQLKRLGAEGEFGEAIVEGPISLDLAIDMESVKIKGYVSEVAGKADCLLFPNIESGNVFYKTNTKFCNAKTAAVVVGTKVPIVLSSRGDSMETKLNSIALAALLGKAEEER